MSAIRKESSRDPELIAARLAPALAEREVEHDRDAVFPSRNVDDLREAGLLALTVPLHAGGFGADLKKALDTLRILAQASPSTALMLAMHTSILANYLLEPADLPEAERPHFEQQREWAWSEAIAGRIFGVANSEPGAAGDLNQSKARVTTSGGKQTLSGLKSFSSFGLHADYYMAAARDESESIEYYLVKNDRDSVEVSKTWDATGMRSSESVELRFTDAAVLGVLGYRGMVSGRNNRHWSTLSFTAIFLGIAESLSCDIVSRATGALQQSEAVAFHLTVQASRAFLAAAVDGAHLSAEKSYLALVRDCKTFVTHTLAKQAGSLYASQTGSAYQFSSPISRKFRDLLAGPALRPPVAIAFEEIWKEIRGGGPRAGGPE